MILKKYKFTEEIMAELRAIAEDNFIDAFSLRLAPEQKNFVSHPITVSQIPLHIRTPQDGICRG